MSSAEEFVKNSVLPRIGNDILAEMLDAAVIRQGNQRLAVTIDGWVVRPLKFPGGDIGRLAVCGTLNNLAVSGARPIGIALGMILTEGIDRQVIEEVLDSIAAAAREAAVRIIAGDTKVMARGEGEGLLLTTCGVGVVARRVRMHPGHVMPGDAIVVSGAVGDHGVAVLAARNAAARGPDPLAAVRSDVAPMNRLVEQVMKRVPGVVFMRDPTRGGIVRFGIDLAARTGLHVRLDEDQIPVRAETRRAAELLGVDPLQSPSQGRVVFVVRPTNVEQALAVLRRESDGTDACVIGHVEDARDGACELLTSSGDHRLLQNPTEERFDQVC